ncbi:ABC-2 family transporter protein [Bacillus sp. FJAT-26390]|uniref:ABC-2 family transporter protein n=1 Tax=Bacillus sp. FJAT-26390 TaxID=1743142 RepID=UPI000807E999|nr:hypothetical protein A7975_10260 [Bacillus sp. FJAT-26390]
MFDFFISLEWKFIADLLPFQFLGFIPAVIYMEKLETSNVMMILGKGCIWILLLWGAVKLLWHKAIKRSVIHGG